MKPAQPTANIDIERARVAGVLATEAFLRRPARAADHLAENDVLLALVRALTGSPDALLQSFASSALALCKAGSAGISLLEGASASDAVFRWIAVAGLCEGLAGTSTERDECPCGMTLALGTPQLFERPQDFFACLQDTQPEVVEGLVVPIPAAEGPHGAIWVISHDPAHMFDPEDARLLTHIATLAGAALTHLNARRRASEEAAVAEAARAQLEESEVRREEFIAMLGHELRNPMSPIESAIGASKHLCASNDEALGVLNVAQRQMRHLRTLVDDLLDAARLKHGKVAIRRSNTSLNEIVFDAVTAVNHHVEARKHVLTLHGIDDPVYVRADHVRLSQVLGNLLSNAAKYTPAGGHIELNVASLPEEPVTTGASGKDDYGVVVITITDDGVGIDPGMLPHVFDLFAQSPSSNARAEGGLGIGLAVAKRMVELHAGTIAIGSTRGGSGTTVTLHLPILDRKRSTLEPSRRDVTPMPAPARLLLVDDNRDALEALKTLLEVQGHKVVAVDNGRDAVELIRSWLPEVAVVDVGMPGMDGFEVARAIRSHVELSSVMIVALTGYASESDKSRALAAGFHYHLTKPLSIDKLNYLLSHRSGGMIQGLV
ncbi:hybrid sensor histidine kinase/response regulator [Paraburkholderia saeva]|uniref:hybrid sensor histidine kinase/response regulator n=1 Tax=Paraburkholderia saeva TaxID=2777537 RepID=UPI001D277034|nr:ATP-binding protein [Paraburkholderia saeva]CAG4889206.1 Sensor histidine kinase RcsC [Paraburkholderia saeva]